MTNEYFMEVVENLRFLARQTTGKEYNEIRLDDTMKNAAAIIEYLMDEIADMLEDGAM